MRTPRVRIALLCVAAALLAPAPPAARAETFSMAAGKQTLSGANCYSFGVLPGTVGASKDPSSSCLNQQYVMPLYWRTFLGAGVTRSVTVRGRVPSSSSIMGCTLSVFNASGSLVSSHSQNFSVTSGYSSITLNVTQITSTSTSFITCAALGPDANLLMKVDYAP